MSRYDPARDVGQLLRTLRERRGVSQRRLAARVGASQQWLSQVERGALNPTVRDLERFFGGLGQRLRFEAVPVASDPLEDPDLHPGRAAEDTAAEVDGYGWVFDRLHDVPCLVGGRLAALAYGLPVRVTRLDLIVAEADRELIAPGVRRLSSVRWSERWQEFCDHTPPERPGPLRWLVGHTWELRVALARELPERVAVRLDDRELPVPPLPWLLANDSDVADLLGRLRSAGWDQPGMPPPT